MNKVFGSGRRERKERERERERAEGQNEDRMYAPWVLRPAQPPTTSLAFSSRRPDFLTLNSLAADGTLVAAVYSFGLK